MAKKIMMKMGEFTFALTTAAYQDFTRQSGYSWAEQPLIGQAPALQFTGRDADSISLRGVIYPHFRGGLAQLPAMRAIAERGKPMLLVSGRGENLGSWVIEKIGESTTTFFGDGTPRKIDFDLSLKLYKSAVTQPRGNVALNFTGATNVTGLA